MCIKFRERIEIMILASKTVKKDKISLKKVIRLKKDKYIDEVVKTQTFFPTEFSDLMEIKPGSFLFNALFATPVVTVIQK